MKKTYIKMNNNELYLSLGNFIWVTKELSKNKNAALQTEIFCVLFELEDIKDTTVNNYCVGIRSIGGEYKQKYIHFKNRYAKEKETMLSIINGILSIIDGTIYEEKNIVFLNQQESIKELSIKLYNIAKNDNNITIEEIKKWEEYLKKKEYYTFMVEVLFYAILKNKQPLYEIDKRKEKIEELLSDSYMGFQGIEDYLHLKLKETINYDYTLKILAKNGNVLANYELGNNEYMGYIKGYPRYIEAYKYLKVASDANHAGAIYLIGNMLYSGFLGNKSKPDLQEAYTYFVEAKNLGSIAAINKLGLMYLQGTYPIKKDKEQAIKMFQEAAEKNYVYALNNLGKIYEEAKKENYIEYYKKSASLKESWACNKMGEYYRKQKEYKKAFTYYQEALEANERNLCYYAYYNLANYFYSTGSKENNIEKDEKKYIEYLEIASNHHILEASIDLLKFYTRTYLQKKKGEPKQMIRKYKQRIENHPNYNKTIKKQVEEQLAKIKEKQELELNIF